mgnify:CR=1 FL=1
MNINLLSTHNTNNFNMSFTGRRKYPKDIPPRKLQFTEAETEIMPVLQKHYTAEANIRTQKLNLRDYYSSYDKADYKELIKENTKLKNKIHRIAKKYSTDEIILAKNIDAKNTYNRYAPKIYRAKKKVELFELKKFISKAIIDENIKAMLLKLIDIIEPFLKK